MRCLLQVRCSIKCEHTSKCGVRWNVRRHWRWRERWWDQSGQSSLCWIERWRKWGWCWWCVSDNCRPRPLCRWQYSVHCHWRGMKMSRTHSIALRLHFASKSMWRWEHRIFVKCEFLDLIFFIFQITAMSVWWENTCYRMQRWTTCVLKFLSISHFGSFSCTLGIKWRLGCWCVSLNTIEYHATVYQSRSVSYHWGWYRMLAFCGIKAL